jgi:hypothetical protein
MLGIMTKVTAVKGLWIVMLVLRLDCYGQDMPGVPRLEVGGIASTTKTLVYGDSFFCSMLSGVGGRAVFNFTPRFGLDFQAGVHRDSGDQFPFYSAGLKMTSREKNVNFFALVGGGGSEIIRHEQDGLYGYCGLSRR